MNISAGPTGDPHTFTQPELARVIHTNLKLIVDFKRKVLKGKAILTIERKPSINEIILDSLGLTILRVTNIIGICLNYHVEINHWGNYVRSLLHVQIPQTVNITYGSMSIFKIQIKYKTCPNSPALYWLTPMQTADHLHPFLLSNNKQIYAKAWFPCQDTPSVKFTYTAKILVPKHFTVLMSANLQELRQINRNLVEHKFFQLKPVPPYAVIIAVGSLRKEILNTRSNLYAENKFFFESRQTFCSSTTENMLQIAENLCGFYFWDRYDICVLPPSIAHFEIECPCVTFVSPTLLCGDLSCISSLARNISQSWAGNLVTCSNYDHLWLNKSFSIFISKKIKCKMLIHEDMKLLLQREELKDLNNMVGNFGNAGSGLLKCLLPDLALLPYEYEPYEMGCKLLDHLENIFGGPSVFEQFLKSYFYKFAFESINTQDWINYLYQYFPDKKEMLDGVLHTYLSNVASPSIVPEMTAWKTKCFKLAEEWAKCDYKVYIPSLLIENEEHLCDVQKIIFLDYLHSFHTYLTKEKLKSISYYYLSNTKNKQILFVWLLLCIKVRWTEKVESALKFAIKFCSPNYACPIFKYLYEWTEMRPLAIRTYEKDREKMLNETKKKLDIILHLNL